MSDRATQGSNKREEVPQQAQAFQGREPVQRAVVAIQFDNVIARATFSEDPAPQTVQGQQEVMSLQLASMAGSFPPIAHCASASMTGAGHDALQGVGAQFESASGHK